MALYSLYSCLALFVTFYVLKKKFSAKRDPREPPVVPALFPLPLVGHLIGLYWYRIEYYTKIR